MQLTDEQRKLLVLLSDAVARRDADVSVALRRLVALGRLDARAAEIERLRAENARQADSLALCLGFLIGLRSGGFVAPERRAATDNVIWACEQLLYGAEGPPGG